jgi:hypothetical protein
MRRRFSLTAAATRRAESSLLVTVRRREKSCTLHRQHFFIVMWELCPVRIILRISEMVFFYISLLYQSISPQGSNYSDSVFFQLNHIISYCFNTFYLLFKPWVFSLNFVIKICQLKRAGYEVFKFHDSKLLYSTFPPNPVAWHPAKQVHRLENK